MDAEKIKRYAKNCIPWRIRYFIKLQEAKGNLLLGEKIKQHRPIEEYNIALRNAMELAEIETFVGKTICEIGSGEYLSHAAMEYMMGAANEYLLEIDDFVGLQNKADVSSFKIGQDDIYIRRLPKESGKNWQDYLCDINAEYYVTGLEGYKKIPDNSVDYLFSFFVLEHIRKNIFFESMKEVYRFMKPGSIIFHNVDYTDHMGGGKNQLRFSEDIWEDSIHYKMDMYTNRIPCSAMAAILQDIGYHIVKCEITRYKKNPISRSKLSADTKYINDDDLKIAKCRFVLRK